MRRPRFEGGAQVHHNCNECRDVLVRTPGAPAVRGFKGGDSRGGQGGFVWLLHRGGAFPSCVNRWRQGADAQGHARLGAALVLGGVRQVFQPHGLGGQTSRHRLSAGDGQFRLPHSIVGPLLPWNRHHAAAGGLARETCRKGRVQGRRGRLERLRVLRSLCLDGTRGLDQVRRPCGQSFRNGIRQRMHRVFGGRHRHCIRGERSDRQPCHARP